MSAMPVQYISLAVVTLSIKIRLHEIMAFYFVDISCAVIVWKTYVLL